MIGRARLLHQGARPAREWAHARRLRQVGCELTEDIREWRALFQEFLLGAKAVLAPSQIPVPSGVTVIGWMPSG